MVTETPIACPLCGQYAHDPIGTLRYDDILKIYRKVYGVEVAPAPVATLQYLRCRGCDLRFYYPPVAGDAAFYERLQKFPWYYLTDKSEFQIAQRFAPAAGTVLEIGCGVGKFSAFLPSACSYRGLEFNEEAVATARRNGLRVDRLTIEELAGREPVTFDMLCCFQVLEHVPSPASLLSTAATLLAPGGVLVISVPSEDSFMSDEVNNVFNMPPHHLTRWSDAALKSVERVTGLQLVRLEHERLSAMHVPAYAKSRIMRFMRRRLKLGIPLVSPLAASLPMRAILYLLAKPAVWRLRATDRPIPGHSVIAVFRKAPVATGEESG